MEIDYMACFCKGFFPRTSGLPERTLQTLKEALVFVVSVHRHAGYTGE